jgi:hypothetical protein
MDCQAHYGHCQSLPEALTAHVCSYARTPVAQAVIIMYILLLFAVLELKRASDQLICELPYKFCARTRCTEVFDISLYLNDFQIIFKPKYQDTDRIKLCLFPKHVLYHN